MEFCRFDLLDAMSIDDDAVMYIKGSLLAGLPESWRIKYAAEIKLLLLYGYWRMTILSNKSTFGNATYALKYKMNSR